MLAVLIVLTAFSVIALLTGMVWILAGPATWQRADENAREEALRGLSERMK